MNENLQNDGLEDFLKKAFDGYEDSPSDGVWTGIQSGLAGSAAVSGAKLIMIKTWQIAAAAAVVTGLFVVQHFYFQNKVNQLTEHLETKTAEYESLNEELNQILEETESEKSNTLNENTSLKNEYGTPESKDALVSEDEIKSLQLSDNQENMIEFEGENIEVNTIQNIENKIQNPEIPEDLAQTHRFNRGQLPKTQETEKNPSENSTEIEKSPASIIDFPEKLTLLTQSNIDFSKSNIPFVLVNPVKEIIPNSKAKGGFYLGANYSRLAAREKVKRVNGKRPRKNEVHGGPGPNPGGKDDCKFSEITGGNGTAELFGISLGYEGNKRWGFESGINYRKTIIDNDHFANFRFDKIDDMGQGSNKFDFDYKLRTPSGEIDIVIRVKDVEPGNKPPKNEEIEFRLSTAQKHTRIAVPLMLTYRAGEGKFNWILKGGTLFNFRLNNTLEVTDAVSSHSKFEFRDLHNVRAEYESLAPVSLDFIASVGMEYHLTNRTSLNLEPILITELTPSHIDTFIDSSKFSFGLNTALVYNF